jgi:hypothetical protein
MESRSRTVGLMERLKEGLHHFWADAEAAVMNDKLHHFGTRRLVFDRADVEANLTILGELEAIANEVRQNLAHSPWITKEDCIILKVAAGVQSQTLFLGLQT